MSFWDFLRRLFGRRKTKPKPLPLPPPFSPDPDPPNPPAGTWPDGVPNVHDWLVDNPHVRSFVKWESSSYDRWNKEDKSLKILLDSREMFIKDFRIARNKAGRAVPAPPEYVMDFISDKIGRTHKETIGNLILWCGDMVHFLGSFTGKNVEDQWQYRGFPPVSRVIDGTPNMTSDTRQHRAAGCHGTTGFLRAVLRAVNIPVEYRYTVGHAQPCFISEGLCLSHGDDPYNGNFKRSGKSVNELFITEATFEEWFRTGDAKYRRSNIGRRPKELAGIV